LEKDKLVKQDFPIRKPFGLKKLKIKQNKLRTDGLNVLEEVLDEESSSEQDISTVPDEIFVNSAKMSPNIRIIIADDSIISLEVLRNQMYSQGYIDNCEFCHNGQEAIKKFT